MNNLTGIEIIGKYDYLQKALKYIIENSSSNDLPYHNLNHLITVMKYCHEGLVFIGAKDESIYKLLLVSALFHDVNHSGGKLSDDKNIELAKKSLIDFVESESMDIDLDDAFGILDATQYPYVIESSELTTLQSIIRDSDLMQIYEYNWLQQNILGLAKELNISIVDFLPGQKKFMDSAVFNTQYGIELKKLKWDSLINEYDILEKSLNGK